MLRMFEHLAVLTELVLGQALRAGDEVGGLGQVQALPRLAARNDPAIMDGHHIYQDVVAIRLAATWAMRRRRRFMCPRSPPH